MEKSILNSIVSSAKVSKKNNNYVGVTFWQAGRDDTGKFKINVVGNSTVITPEEYAKVTTTLQSSEITFSPFSTRIPQLNAYTASLNSLKVSNPTPTFAAVPPPPANTPKETSAETSTKISSAEISVNVAEAKKKKKRILKTK